MLRRLTAAALSDREKWTGVLSVGKTNQHRRRWNMERFFAGVWPGPDLAGWLPVMVQTRSYTRPVDPVAYDCVKVMLIRQGSVILFSEFGERPARAGDLIVLCATTLCGAVPEGTVTVSTAYVDADYLLDQLAWRHAEHLADRYATEAMIERSFHLRADLIHLNRRTAERLAKVLDQIEAGQVDGADAFYRTQALFAGVMEQ